MALIYLRLSDEGVEGLGYRTAEDYVVLYRALGKGN